MPKKMQIADAVVDLVVVVAVVDVVDIVVAFNVALIEAASYLVNVSAVQLSCCCRC